MKRLEGKMEKERKRERERNREMEGERGVGEGKGERESILEECKILSVHCMLRQFS